MALPSYERPPVQEVVCGVVFREIEGFGTSHYGLFWERIRDKYPLVEDVAPLTIPVLGQTSDAATEFTTVPPLRRVWYVHESRDRLIQLQPDAFLYNWRRVDASSAYPRFETVYSEFMFGLAELEGFLEIEALPSISDLQYELTYINHIPKSEGWDDLDDLRHVFRDVSAPPSKVVYGELKSVDYRLVFDLPDSAGQLTVRIRSALRKADNVPLIAMDVIARGHLGDRSKKRTDWFTLAHETIVNGFGDFTTAEIQERYWGRHK
jgi:uncharacterized protein (TIGR04255 family)